MKKETKRHMVLLFKGNMPKFMRKEFCQPDKERVMMLGDKK